MPILPQEPDVFPATLFERDFAAGAGALWWAGYTLPRRKKS